MTIATSSEEAGIQTGIAIHRVAIIAFFMLLVAKEAASHNASVGTLEPLLERAAHYLTERGAMGGGFFGSRPLEMTQLEDLSEEVKWLRKKAQWSFWRISVPSRAVATRSACSFPTPWWRRGWWGDRDWRCGWLG